MAYVYETIRTEEIAHRLCQDEYAGWHKNYIACLAIANYLEDLSEGLNTPIELDIVAIRCEYSLMYNLADFNRQYDKECETLDDVREFTQIIEIETSDSFIIQDF